MDLQEKERKRLLDETRLSVKSLLSTCSHENYIDDNSPQLDRFCLVLEKIFRHGMKGLFLFYYDDYYLVFFNQMIHSIGSHSSRQEWYLW